MKHDSSHPWGEAPSSSGMTTPDAAATVEIRDNAYETIPVFWWDWPDEAQLADSAEKHDRMEQIDQAVKDDAAYAALYFVS